jgi:hypothetical protein
LLIFELLRAFEGRRALLAQLSHIVGVVNPIAKVLFLHIL